MLFKKSKGDNMKKLFVYLFFLFIAILPEILIYLGYKKITGFHPFGMYNGFILTCAILLGCTAGLYWFVVVVCACIQDYYLER